MYYNVNVIICVLTMKKFLSICLAALMISSMVSVAAFAAAADWTSGNGFHIIEVADDGSRVEVEKNSPVTVTDNADGTIHVTHGGYYQSGDNWGGVSSNDTYNLNGLKVDVTFEEIPEATASTDCWMAVDFLKNCGPFYAAAANVADNPGFMSLVRFSQPAVSFHNGVDSFAALFNSSNILEDNSMFAIGAGDTLTVSVKMADTGYYEVTYTKNGESSYTITPGVDIEVVNAKALAELFADGKAHVTVMASCLGSQPDGFKYNVKVTDGTEFTAADIEANAAALAASQKEADDKLADEQAALDAMLGLTDGETEEQPEETPADDTNNDSAAPAVVDDAEDSSVNVGLIIAIIAIVVVVAVVVIVVLKKKGNK